jgi:NAD(P)-dependent dehydrogenase (short-subunit alcohol dehydrogenase family)
VVLAARDGRTIEALAADIRSVGGHAVAVPTDLTSPVSVRRLVEQTLGAFGRLDAAVNNAQVSLAMKHEIPVLRRAGGGRIVNLAPTADVIELTRTAALDFAGAGVRINAVAAGPLDSAEDVAAAVVWLCSDDASLVTGATLPADRPLWAYEVPSRGGHGAGRACARTTRSRSRRWPDRAP